MTQKSTCSVYEEAVDLDCNAHEEIGHIHDVQFSPQHGMWHTPDGEHILWYNNNYVTVYAKIKSVSRQKQNVSAKLRFFNLQEPVWILESTQ